MKARFGAHGLGSKQHPLSIRQASPAQILTIVTVADVTAFQHLMPLLQFTPSINSPPTPSTPLHSHSHPPDVSHPSFLPPPVPIHPVRSSSPRLAPPLSFAYRSSAWEKPRIFLYASILAISVALTDLLEEPLHRRLKTFSDRLQQPGGGKNALQRRGGMMRGRRRAYNRVLSVFF